MSTRKELAAVAGPQPQALQIPASSGEDEGKFYRPIVRFDLKLKAWEASAGTLPPGHTDPKFFPSLLDVLFLFAAAESLPATFAGNIARAVFAISRQVEAYLNDPAEDEGNESDVRNYVPGREVLSNWQRITQALTMIVADPPRLETLAELKQLPNLQPSQAAQMTGFTVAQVKAEWEEPGTIPEGTPYPGHAKAHAERMASIIGQRFTDVTELRKSVAAIKESLQQLAERDELEDAAA